MDTITTLFIKYPVDSSVRSAPRFSVSLTSLCAVVSTFVSLVSTSGLLDSEASRAALTVAPREKVSIT